MAEAVMISPMYTTPTSLHCMGHILVKVTSKNKISVDEILIAFNENKIETYQYVYSSYADEKKLRRDTTAFNLM